VVSERPELFPFYRDLGYSTFGTKPFPDTVRLKKPCHFVSMRRSLGLDEVLFGRRGHDFVLDTRLFLPRALDPVFAFFADASNLDALTPPWMHFRILTPLPLEMRAGALIDYRLRLHGFPISWRTEITAWDPPRRFVDEQRRGPYTHWRHEHVFTETDEGTLVEDRVRYLLPGGGLAHALLVRRDLERIFRYRQEQVRVRLAPGGGR
jgi:ligand-binding SRPBCC domain-containing protein